MRKHFWILVSTLFFITACDSGKEEIPISPDVYHHSMEQLSEVIVHDIFSPPVASRIYAYPSIALYEILTLEDTRYKSFSGQLIMKIL